MIIIIDKVTNKQVENMGTNKNFPDGNIPNLPTLSPDKKYIKLHDNSPQVKLIMTAHDYTLVEDNGDIIVNVIKTKAQYKSEQPPPPKSKEVIAIDELKLIDTKSLNPLDLARRLDIIEKLLGII